MKYHSLLGKMSQNLSSAAVVIGALRLKKQFAFHGQIQKFRQRGSNSDNFFFSFLGLG